MWHCILNQEQRNIQEYFALTESTNRRMEFVDALVEVPETPIEAQRYTCDCKRIDTEADGEVTSSYRRFRSRSCRSAVTASS